MKTTSYDLTDRTDQHLVQNLKALLSRERETLAEVLAHIGEVDHRRLYRQYACHSLFDYCVSRLRLSEAAAGKRITAARLARRFDAILPMVARGELHLSGLSLLSSHLNEDNHEELLQAACNQSKRAIEQVLADRNPKPDAPTLVRKLPSTTSAPRPDPQLELEGSTAKQDESKPTESRDTTTETRIAQPVTSRANICAGRNVTQPLGDERFRIQFTASKQLRDKLQQAQDLMRHAEPDSDLATLVERGIDLLLAEVKAKRFGIPKRKASRARCTTEASKEERTTRVNEHGSQKATATRSSSRCSSKQSRYIPSDIRRQVYERDKGRCTYRDAQGNRCSSRAVEFHHHEPFALGGASTVDELSLRCRSHNLMAAEGDFGKDWMAKRIHSNQQSQRAPGRASPRAMPRARRCQT